MANEGVIKIKGDTKELIDALDKAGVKFQQLGAHGEKAATHARTFGQSWEHANNHMVRTVAHAVSIGGALHLAVELLRDFQEESEKASRAVGSLAAQEAAITRKTGISPEKVAGYVGAPSPVPKKELTEFAGELASMHHVGRAERTVTETEFAKSMTARIAGYDPDEIRRALEKGRLDELTPEKITAGLTEEQRSQRNTAIYENQMANRAEDKRAAGGLENRRAGASYDAASAGTILDIPFVRNILRASAEAQGMGNSDGGRGGAYAGEWNAITGQEPGWSVRKAVEAQTEALKPPPTTAGKMK